MDKFNSIENKVGKINLTYEEENYLNNKKHFNYVCRSQIGNLLKNSIKKQSTCGNFSWFNKTNLFKIRNTNKSDSNKILGRECWIFKKLKKCDIMSFLNQTPQRETWLNFTNTLLQTQM